jgi:hypothetical protein
MKLRFVTRCGKWTLRSKGGPPRRYGAGNEKWVGDGRQLAAGALLGHSGPRAKATCGYGAVRFVQSGPREGCEWIAESRINREQRKSVL